MKTGGGTPPSIKKPPCIHSSNGGALRVRTWMLPSQLLIGLLMLYTATQLEDLLGDGQKSRQRRVPEQLPWTPASLSANARRIFHEIDMFAICDCDCTTDHVQSSLLEKSVEFIYDWSERGDVLLPDSWRIIIVHCWNVCVHGTLGHMHT